MRPLFYGCTQGRTNGKYCLGIFQSVSGGISRYYQYQYQRISRSVRSVSKFWLEPLKKLAVAPFFLRRGGFGPRFVHFALLLKKKRNSRGIFQKKSSREIFKRCSRQNLQYKNTNRKYRKPSKSDTSRIPIPKKLLVQHRGISTYIILSLWFYHTLRRNHTMVGYPAQPRESK